MSNLDGLKSCQDTAEQIEHQEERKIPNFAQEIINKESKKHIRLYSGTVSKGLTLRTVNNRAVSAKRLISAKQNSRRRPLSNFMRLPNGAGLSSTTRLGGSTNVDYLAATEDEI